MSQKSKRKLAKRAGGGYRRAFKPTGMKDAEFLLRTKQIKKLSREIAQYEAAMADQAIVEYDCKITRRKQHTFGEWWTRSPRAKFRPPDMPLPKPTKQAA